MAPVENSGSGAMPSCPTSNTEADLGYWGTPLATVEKLREIVTLAPSSAPPKNPSAPSQKKGRKRRKRGATSKEQNNSNGATGADAAATAPVEYFNLESELRNLSTNETCDDMDTIEEPVYISDDKLLRALTASDGKWKKISWAPGSGRHIDQGREAYLPFKQIVRTLHLDDAIDVLANNRMKPKKLITFSSLEHSFLPSDHPCKNIKILWFSSKPVCEEEDSPNWYGNVEFAISSDLLMQMFQHFFLVELVTTPTHTMSRILMTNKDYSAVLPRFKIGQTGGAWKVTSEGHMALQRCSRYRFMGRNLNGHSLEFLLEVTPQDERKILSNCEISFKNHEDAKNIPQPHVCNRSQRMQTVCPSPFTPQQTAQMFYQQLQEINMDWNKVYPKLSKQAQQLLS